MGNKIDWNDIEGSYQRLMELAAECAGYNEAHLYLECARELRLYAAYGFGKKAPIDKERDEGKRGKRKWDGTRWVNELASLDKERDEGKKKTAGGAGQKGEVQLASIWDRGME